MNEIDQLRLKGALISKNSAKSKGTWHLLRPVLIEAHKYSYKHIFIMLYSDIFFESLKWCGLMGP